MKKTVFSLVLCMFISNGASKNFLYATSYYDYPKSRIDDRHKFQEQDDEAQQKLNQINHNFKISLDRTGKTLVNVIKSLSGIFSDANLKTLFKFIQTKLDDAYLYSIFMNLDFKSEFANSFNDFFPDQNSIPYRPVNTRLDRDFYVGLINELSKKGMKDDVLESFKSVLKETLDDDTWSNVESKLSYLQEEKVSKLKQLYKNSLDDNAKIFVRIIKNSIYKLPTDAMKLIFDSVAKNFGKEFLYAVFISLDRNDTVNYFNIYFAPNELPEKGTQQFVNKNFYITLLNDVAQNGLPDDLFKAFKKLIKDNVNDLLWKDIKAAIGDDRDEKEEKLKNVYKNQLLQDPKGKMFLMIMQKSFNTFSKNKMKKLIDVLFKKNGKPMIFALYASLDKNITLNYFDDYLKDLSDLSDKPDLGNQNSKFYAYLIDALSKSNFKDEHLQKFKDIIISVIGKDKWAKIEAKLVDDPAQSSDKTQNVWSSTDDLMIKNLKDLFKANKNVSIPQIANQLLQDMTTTYLTPTNTSEELNKLTLSANTKSKKDTMRHSLHQLLKAYKTFLDQKKIDSKFLDAVGNSMKIVLKNDYPQVVSRYYQLYINQIAGNRDLINKINSGFRVNIASSVTSYQNVADKNKVKFNADVFCFMLIQVIATLEKQLETTDKMPNNLSEYRQQIAQTLNDVTYKFGADNNLIKIKESILQGLDNFLQETDTNILFGLMIFQSIDQMNFSDAQKVAVLSTIQKQLEAKGVSVDALKQSIIGYQKNRQDNLKFVHDFLNNDPAKVLLPFTAPGQNLNKADNVNDVESIKDNASKQLATGVNSAIANVFGKFFGVKA